MAADSAEGVPPAGHSVLSEHLGSPGSEQDGGKTRAASAGGGTALRQLHRQRQYRRSGGEIFGRCPHGRNGCAEYANLGYKVGPFGRAGGIQVLYSEQSDTAYIRQGLPQQTLEILETEISLHSGQKSENDLKKGLEGESIMWYYDTR